jgi:hypothetical protein
LPLNIEGRIGLALSFTDPRDPWLLRNRVLLGARADMMHLLMVFAIWIVLCAVQLQMYAPAIAKSRISEMLGAEIKRIDVVEHLAITGTWLGSDDLLQAGEAGRGGGETTRGGGDDARQSYLKGQSAAKKPEARESETADGGLRSASRISGPDGKGGEMWNQYLGLDAKSRYVSGVVEGTIVTTAKISGIEQPVLFMIQPAVPAGEPAATVVWLCGRASPPPGWQRVGPLNATNLGRELLSFPCRT